MCDFYSIFFFFFFAGDWIVIVLCWRNNLWSVNDHLPLMLLFFFFFFHTTCLTGCWKSACFCLFKLENTVWALPDWRSSESRRKNLTIYDFKRNFCLVLSTQSDPVALTLPVHQLGFDPATSPSSLFVHILCHQSAPPADFFVFFPWPPVCLN